MPVPPNFRRWPPISQLIYIRDGLHKLLDAYAHELDLDGADWAFRMVCSIQRDIDRLARKPS